MGTPFTIHSVAYLMKDLDSPDEILTLAGTNATFLDKPLTTAWPLNADHFTLSDDMVQHIDYHAEEDGYAIQCVPLFPYKIATDAISYDVKAVEMWYDGVPRLRGGSLTFMSSSVYVDHFLIHHEQQLETIDKTYNAILGRLNGTFYSYSFISNVLANESHFYDLRADAVAHRLTKTLILRVKIWWIYRLTVFHQSSSI